MQQQSNNKSRWIQVVGSGKGKGGAKVQIVSTKAGVSAIENNVVLRRPRKKWFFDFVLPGQFFIIILIIIIIIQPSEIKLDSSRASLNSSSFLNR